jgi:3-oxoacyl-(acyl-carrier-protein) synthase III
MSARDIYERTGIRERCYTDRSLDDLVADAAFRAFEVAPDSAHDVAAVVACSVTNTQPIPSLAARVADRVALNPLAGVFDVVAACAGFPYGLAQASRIVEETGGSVLLVLGEKFADKTGTVRSSRMIFGDGAAALLLTPCPHEQGDIEFVETYAGGSSAEVHSVVWPNPAFNNHLTVDAQGARSIVQRYLSRILSDLADRTPPQRSPMDDVDLIVPHQANERMVRELATAAGIPDNRLYFDIDRVGNLSAASIPIAIDDAIAEGRITGGARILTPAFGAGSVAGVALLRIPDHIVAAAGHQPTSLEQARA